ncbi:HD domain-containing phosphohydrolase [Desulfovibrio sp. JC010]|uniref:HD domain-containing phosphohydrolase n=1 Tax=Desulfovibrio sp. JC010 TaxID=2593641 RepID=UPI0013D4CBC1|nr:HD domain-containing phosphohydrolase [Desulfovibrio sp. JC010]NDV26787.1 response regulator [Desulfovibrio sp. JC010]
MKQVLIVDDTVENLQVLMEALKGEYAVVTAKNGEKALELAVNKPRPDIILLDIMMPGMNGYEVCERLKADVRTKDIPVIFITVLMEEEDEARGLALGAVDYIVKPFCPDLVKARVKNQLDLKEHKDHLERLVKERTKELALVKKVTIECLATLAEWRDPETGGHIARTQNYVKILAEHAMKREEFASELNEELIETLYLSAPLHDVGKVGVADAILLKPGKLTDEEFEEMKKHSQYGCDALAGAENTLGGNSFLHHAREIAFYHHEKWDGTGYPKGTSGEDIPLSARIMAIADVYDALISKRVYKDPFPHSKAVKIIAEGRGTHFDPRLTDIFLDIQEEFRGIALEFADFDEERETLKQ